MVPWTQVIKAYELINQPYELTNIFFPPVENKHLKEHLIPLYQEKP